eukprot:jgi/Ulvmu1/12416/UM009_0066.1
MTHMLSPTPTTVTISPIPLEVRKPGRAIWDSGAGCHVFGTPQLMLPGSFRPIKPGNVTVIVGGGERHSASGTMAVCMTLGNGAELTFSQVLYVPGIFVNVISVSRAAKVSGNIFSFTDTQALMHVHKGPTLCVGYEANGLYHVSVKIDRYVNDQPSHESYLRAHDSGIPASTPVHTLKSCLKAKPSLTQVVDVQTACYTKENVHAIVSQQLSETKENELKLFVMAGKPSDPVELLHKRLAHVSHQVVGNMIRQKCALGLPSKMVLPDHKCDVCQLAKQARLRFEVHEGSAEEPLALIHADLMGPFLKRTEFWS